MLLSKLHVTNFRNFPTGSFEFGSSLTLIVGKNARGKTSLLEGVHTVVYGTGFRESRESELVHWDAHDCLLDAVFTEHGVDMRFQVKIGKIDDSRVQKKFFINKAVKSPSVYRKSRLQAVLFAPEQIRVVTGSPSRKRNYFDAVISAVDPAYKKAVRSYERALRRRNKVLEIYVHESDAARELSYWNTLVVEYGTEIYEKRKNYIAFLNDHPSVGGRTYRISYIPSVISLVELGRIYRKELAFRRTLIGPQRDDFEIDLDGEKPKNISLFGSRSEQRMAVFWLKHNELSYFEKVTKTRPLLLLDDIFSELDDANRDVVMQMITAHQTVATTTEENIKELSRVPERVIQL